MLKESIKVRAPATVANVSCGFDCLGYAISDPADIVTISKNNNIEQIGFYGDYSIFAKSLLLNNINININEDCIINSIN